MKIPKIAKIMLLVMVALATTTILLASAVFYYQISRSLFSGANYSPASYAYLGALLLVDLFAIWNLYRIIWTGK
ncbi:hypothetical protein [Brevundimonas sp.]|uniref:hypothetical protein n=1 Tax=Brevundimonas sp. TaxID=1871086 RepID=UPI0017FA0CAC|nr:hypothetical protein [Brevundimonas sp.]MBA3048911.1 hypothetical protein [Brevundimonas sp.]